MQRSSRRLTKQELKEDEFVNKVMAVWAYVQDNYPKVIAGVGAVIIVILVGVMIRQQAEQARRAAVEALGSVRVSLMQGQVEAAILEAERVAEEYSGKPAAGQALQMLGNIYFDAGRRAEAQAAFQRYLDEYGAEGAWGYGAWSGVAACLEEQGDAAGAGEKYLAYASKFPKSAFAPLALQEAARCFRLADAPERARSALQKIVDGYPDSQSARTAQAELGMMGALN